MSSRKDNKGRVLRKGESQRKNTGQYVYTYFDVFGKRRYVYNTDLLKLRELEAAINKDLDDGINTYGALNMTFDKCYNGWLEANRKVRLSTKYTYQNNYRLHIEEVFGKRKVSTIKFSEVVRFYNALLDNGMSSKTLELIHTVMHSTFQFAIKEGVIRSDPSSCALREVKDNDTNPNEKQPLTLLQQKAFLQYIRENDNHKFWYHVFVFLLGTGCRIGEALGLTWNDVNFEDRVIDINHQKKSVYVREERRVITTIGEPKNKQSTRKLPMFDEVYNVLKAEFEFQEKYGHCHDVIDGMTDFVFFINDRHVLDSNTCNGAIDRIVKEYNAKELEKSKLERREPLLLPHFTVHNLRHTYCTRLCENELNIKAIQALMGHSNIHTTMNIYAKATEEKKKEVVQQIDNKIDMF